MVLARWKWRELVSMTPKTTKSGATASARTGIKSMSTIPRKGVHVGSRAYLSACRSRIYFSNLMDLKQL
jgi:hypothetical protein